MSLFYKYYATVTEWGQYPAFTDQETEGHKIQAALSGYYSSLSRALVAVANFSWVFRPKALDPKP